MLAIGTLPTAMLSRNGIYLAGVFSDDDDGKGRFYVNLPERFATAQEAFEFAKKACYEESYRSWHDGYECKLFQNKGKAV